MGHTILPQLNTTSLRFVSGVPSVRISTTGIQYLTSIENTLLPSTGLAISILFTAIPNVREGLDHINTELPTAGHTSAHILLPTSLHHANSAPAARYPLA